jgi:hypothetical protein
MTTVAVNFSGLHCDQEQTPPYRGSPRHIRMESIRPDTTDPIPLRNPPPRMGALVIRFVGLLAVAVVVLALIWSR